MASMPLSGLTAFGIRGNMSGGLIGRFYDLKQTPNHKPTDVNGSGNILRHSKILEEFFSGGWDENVLKRYFQAQDQVTAYQIFMPKMASSEATKAFGVEKEIKGLNWVVHYKGSVRAPKDGLFRFVGYGDDMLAVRFDAHNVFAAAWVQPITVDMFRKVFASLYSLKEPQPTLIPTSSMDTRGTWFQVYAGKTYPIEIIASEAYGGSSGYMLAIQERGSDPLKGKNNQPVYPIFALKKALPIPPGGPEMAIEPTVFLGK